MREWTADTRAALALLLLAAAPLYVWGLGTVGFQDPDEGMYAEIAREMLASGDWIVPTFNGVPYIEKPPLMYWLTAGALAVLGPSEFAARLWKVLPVLGAIAATWALGARLFSPRVGIVGAGILATTLGTFLFSRISVMDPLLVLGIALASHGVALAGRRGRRADLWFWGGIAIGVMSKGLPGLAFPLGLLGVWTAVLGDIDALRAVSTWRGISLAALSIVPWHALAAWKIPGFFRFYVVDNQILRFLGTRAYAEDGTSLGTVAFLGVTAVALFPWAPILAGAVGLAARGWARDPGLRFLLGWIGLVVGLLAVSSFKLEYYALPAFPAAALVAAVLICRASDQSPAGMASPGPSGRASRGALRQWVWISLIGGILYTLTVAWVWRAGHLTPTNIIRGLSFWSTNYRIVLEQGLPLPPVSEGPYVAVLLGGGALWTAGFGAAVWCLSRKGVPAATAAIGGVGVGLCLLASAVLNEVGPHHSLKPLAERLGALLRPDDVLIHERGLEKGGGLLFYTHRQVLVLNGRRGDLEFGSNLPGSSRWFIDTRQFREVWNGRARAFLITDLPAQRSAISEASPGVPMPVAATGTRWLYANRPIE
jgi:4-amino-4-deoxy-L-arabinose transferase-like glycosyltransferase